MMDGESTRVRMVAIFLLSAAGLLLQVSMTRVLSLVAWHHFAYLIISLALLGIGAAGTYLTVTPGWRESGSVDRWIARWAWGFSIATLLSLLFITRIRFAPLAIYQQGDWSQLYSLFFIEAAIAAPYFFAGVAMGAILSTARGKIGTVYFADLAGAALGSLLALGLINGLGAISSIFAAAVLAAGAAWVLARGEGERVPRRYPGTLAIALVLVVVAVSKDLVPIRFPPSKLAYGQEHLIETTRWNAIARIDVLKSVVGRYVGFAAGLSVPEENPPPPFNFRSVAQDGAAPTYIVNLTDDPRSMRILGHYLQGLAYVGRTEPRVLVIGVGGGVDVVLALHYGADSVVGVEVNPATVDLLRTKYLTYSGYLAERPDVELHVAEGRHFVTRDPRKFDVIQLSGVDTFTALSSGAYALTENYLYTVEAIHDFLDHLRPQGVLSMARWLFDPPRETLRLVSTELRALEERGVADAASRFVIVSGLPRDASKAFPWAETLVKLEPFSREEVARHRQWATERGFGMVYDPYVQRDNIFDRIIRADPESRTQILDDYLYEASPSTDDNPFFFQFYRWRNLVSGDLLRPELVTGPGSARGARRTGRTGEIPIGLVILFSSVLFILILSVLFIAAPLRRGVGSLAGVPWKGGVIGYFALVGLGFMFVEIVLLQKLTVFLGGPTYSMAITLSSLLFFTGVGAAFSRLLQGNLSRRLAAAIVGLGGMLVVEYAFLQWGVPALLGLSHLARCFVAVLAIVPLGLFLGAPFPVGLRLLGPIDERLVPWAYGINGCASVLGGMLCVILSMALGLTAAWFAALVLYLAAAGILLTAPQEL
jgi:hypothetical protein